MLTKACVCFIAGQTTMAFRLFLPISLILVSYACGVIVYENAVFQKVNEITTTRARWLVTFVHDLGPFKYFLAQVKADIDSAANITDAIMNNFDGDKQDSFRNTLVNLREEVDSLDKTFRGILQSYTAYRLLGSRSRRSLFPAVGHIMSFLFGTVSSADLDDVRRGINELSQNQKDIVHVLEEQMTILNVSRVQIAENRDAIIDLVKCVTLFKSRLRKLTEEIEKRFEHIEMFVNLYSQMDLILSGIKDAMQRAMLYLENLRLELNMLSLDHLSPSTITPQALKLLLIQIKTRLPSSLKLPEDPETNIWYYYRTLTCTTVLENDKVLVLINLPLLDYNGQYEVYSAVSVPVPLHQNFTKSSGLPDMVAKYKIEYPGLLIDKDRRQYALLTDNEIKTCGNPIIKYCSPKNAVLPVNLHRLCILALFFKDTKKVDNYCNKIVEPNAILPAATYISSGQWLVSAKTPLEFSIVCLASDGRRSTMSQNTQKMQSFIDIIRLKSGCHAANDYLNLPPYYEFEEQIKINDPLKNLLIIRNTTKFRIWDSFVESFSSLTNITEVELPKNLKSIERIPMNDLLMRLKGLNQVKVKDNSWPTWVYILINLGVVLILILLLFWYCKVRRSNGKWSPNNKCLRSLAGLCEGRGRSNNGKPNPSQQSTGADDELAMTTLLRDGKYLACRQPDPEENQSSIFGQSKKGPQKSPK